MKDNMFLVRTSSRAGGYIYDRYKLKLNTRVIAVLGVFPYCLWRKTSNSRVIEHIKAYINVIDASIKASLKNLKVLPNTEF